MRFRLEVDGNPVSALLESVTIQNELAGRTSKASFKVRVGTEAHLDASPTVYDTAVYESADYFKALLNAQAEIIIYNAATDEKKFRGTVVNISQEIKAPDFQWWEITCIGMEYLLQQVTVNDEWTATKARDIIQAVFGSLLPEIATTSATVADLGSTLDLKAKDLTLRALLDRLASLVDAEYFVTPEKVLVWRLAGSVTAPFGFDAAPDYSTTYPYDSLSRENDAVGFANRVIALGGFFGTLGAELRSQADDTASQTALGRVIRAIVPARDINNQAALDLFASIELERRGSVLEHVKLRAHIDRPGFAGNIPDTLQVGQILTVHSNNGGITGSYAIQTITYSLKSQDWVVVSLELGDYKRKLAESMRRLEKIRVDPLVPPVPPPPDSITNDMVHDVNFSKVVMDVLIDSSQIDTINFAQVTGVTITDSMISDVSFSKVTGTVTVSAGNITGSLNFSQISAATVNITNSMLASGIDFSKIDSLTISITNSMLSGGINITGSQIANLTITDGNIANNTISNAKIVSLDCSKLTAGTIAAAISISSGGSLSCAGSFVCTGTFTVSGLSNSISNGLDVGATLNLSGIGALTVGGSQSINSSNQFVGGGGVNTGGDINTSGVFKKGGTQVVTSRQTGPGTPSFSSVADAQTWCAALLSALQTHGLVT